MSVVGKGFSGRGDSKCKEAKAGHCSKFFKEEKEPKSLEGSEQKHGKEEKGFQGWQCSATGDDNQGQLPGV